MSPHHAKEEKYHVLTFIFNVFMCIPLYVCRLVPLFFSRGNSDGSFVTNLLKNIYSSNAKGLENDLYQWYTGVTRETSIRGWDSYVNRGSMRNAVTRVNQK